MKNEWLIICVNKIVHFILNSNIDKSRIEIYYDECDRIVFFSYFLRHIYIYLSIYDDNYSL